MASERSQDPQSPPLTSLTTGVLHLPTVQREEVGHTSGLHVPSCSSSLSPSHYPPPGLGKTGFAFLCPTFHLCQEHIFVVMDGRVLSLLWNPLGLVPDMLEGKKQRFWENHLSES